MRVRRFDWEDPIASAKAMRDWVAAEEPEGLGEIVDRIGDEIVSERDVALRRLTKELDGVENLPTSLRVDPNEARAALDAVGSEFREALEAAALNIRLVAEPQVGPAASTVELPQGQTVKMRELPVETAGIYAPGGRAAYPTSVLMAAIPARVAGVGNVVLASPPGTDGRISQPVLAAAALCEIDEIYAIGGAQAIFALAYGTETVASVDVIVGPGNDWVQEAKQRVMGLVGIDSYAGPSELMVVAGHDTNPKWAALDLCAQAEHGPDSPLVVVAVEEAVIEAIAVATKEAAAARRNVSNAQLALIQVPDLTDAIDLANAYAPEHLELLEEEAGLQADRVRTAGCVFVGRHGATAFGDYVAGSNHVLPTTGTGHFAGPLGPGTFRRKISNVEITAKAAAQLAPLVDTIAKAEGLPVHGESAMIRAEDE